MEDMITMQQVVLRIWTSGLCLLFLAPMVLAQEEKPKVPNCQEYLSYSHSEKAEHLYRTASPTEESLSSDMVKLDAWCAKNPTEIAALWRATWDELRELTFPD